MNHIQLIQILLGYLLWIFCSKNCVPIMEYNLLQITRKSLKNLCFGCADCLFCIEIWVWKNCDYRCLWLIADNFSVYVSRSVIAPSIITKNIMNSTTTHKRIMSYEELLNHYSDGGAWLK